MNEKFSLKWNKFQQHTSLTFKDLRADNDHFDVTLACDDNNDISAHKIILSACSPYFRNLLSRNKHPHPLVYMRGMQTKDMETILDFMYQGEVDIAQENLPRFLEIADELKISGLDSSEPNRNVNVSDSLEEAPVFFPSEKNINPCRQNGYNMSRNEDPVNSFYKQQSTRSFPLEPQETKYSSELELAGAKYDEFDDSSLIVDDNSVANYNNPAMIHSEGDDPSALIESLIQKIENGKWQCNVCMKIQKSKNHAKEHAEIHIEGMSYPCDYCGKICRTTGALRHHKRVHIRKQQDMAGIQIGNKL